MDPVLVTLGDVSLRKSDLVLLNDGEWLNDAVIQFALERLELDGAVDRQRTALVGPAVVHLLRHIDDEDFARSVANPLKLESKETVFLPVNDSEGLDAPGGSHWSLLVFSRRDNSFFYYDSLSKYNIEAAKRVRDKLWPLLRRHKSDPKPHFQEMDIQKQLNGYDCGVYVICMTELLVSRLGTSSFGVTGKPGDISQWKMQKVLTPEEVSRKRKELRKNIDELANK